MKHNVLIVNTSRGEIINETDLVEFLEKNPDSKVAVDVLSDEIIDRNKSPLLRYAVKSNQVTITQHIGGMTKEAQIIAYCHAAKLLQSFINIKRISI
jgi:D-3-phosphoglycerate dehydrogenase